MCYMYITPRAWWAHYAREYASLLDYHMSRFVDKNMRFFKLNDLYVEKRTTMHKDNGYMENILTGFLDNDRIHLNRLGYHLVTRLTLVTLSLSKYGKKRPASASKKPNSKKAEKQAGTQKRQ